jgi:hypothetical protein
MQTGLATALDNLYMAPRPRFALLAATWNLHTTQPWAGKKRGKGGECALLIGGFGAVVEGSGRAEGSGKVGACAREDRLQVGDDT